MLFFFRNGRRKGLSEFFPFSFVPVAGLLRNLRLIFCFGLFLKPIDKILKLSAANVLWSPAYIKIYIILCGNIKLLVDRKFNLMNLFFGKPNSNYKSRVLEGRMESIPNKALHGLGSADAI